MVTIVQPEDIDYHVEDYLKRAGHIYSRQFIHESHEPWDMKVVVEIAKLIEVETARVTMLVQLETLLARKGKYGK